MPPKLFCFSRGTFRVGDCKGTRPLLIFVSSIMPTFGTGPKTSTTPLGIGAYPKGYFSKQQTRKFVLLAFFFICLCKTQQLGLPFAIVLDADDNKIVLLILIPHITSMCVLYSIFTYTYVNIHLPFYLRVYKHVGDPIKTNNYPTMQRNCCNYRKCNNWEWFF